MPGFGVRTKSSGVMFWLVQCRNAQLRTRRITLGRVGAPASDEARKMALKVLQKSRGVQILLRSVRQTARRLPSQNDASNTWRLEEGGLSRARLKRIALASNVMSIRPVGRAAIILLNGLLREAGQEFVFPATAGDGHLIGLPHV